MSLNLLQICGDPKAGAVHGCSKMKEFFKMKVKQNEGFFVAKRRRRR